MGAIASLTEDFAGAADGVALSTANSQADNVTVGGSATFDDDVLFGDASLQTIQVVCAAQDKSIRFDHTPAAGGWRLCAFRFNGSTAAAYTMAGIYVGGTVCATVRRLTDNSIVIRDPGGTARWTSPILNVGDWYELYVRGDQLNARLEVWRNGALIASGSSGDLTTAGWFTTVGPPDNFRIGCLSSATADVHFARIRGTDDNTKPASGVSPSTAAARFTVENRTIVDAATSDGTVTLTQVSGTTAASVTGPDGADKFTVIHPNPFTADMVFELEATSGLDTDIATVTIPVGSVDRTVLTFDGTAFR